jgi:hypothetical protein
MPAIHVDTGTYGAKRQSFHDASPRGLLEKVVRQHPNADQDELEEAHWELMVKQIKAGNLEFVKAMHAYWFAPNLRSLIRFSEQQRNLKRNQAKASAIATAKAASTKAKSVFESITRIVILDLVLPNGKKLRDCTGKDCAKAGGLYAKIAGRVKPNQIVGQVLTEDQIRKMWGA